MRPVDRIDYFMAFLAYVWKTCCPDWRFGQFISNVMGSVQEEHGDIFFPEEDRMMQYICEYFDLSLEEVQAAMAKKGEIL